MKGKLKNKINYEVSRRKGELKRVEYVLLWIMRAALIFSIFYAKTHGRPSHILLAIICNFAATFCVSVFSVVFPEKLLIGRLPYKTQVYISYFAFLGSTIGQALNIGWSLIDNYDKWLHLFSGYLVVFMGYHIFKAISPKKEVDKKQAMFAGFGFSCIVAIGWEVFEFMADFYIPGSNNQGYNLSPDYTMLFFKIFGHGAGNEGQYPVYDTMFDLLVAIVGAVLALIAFIIMEKVGAKVKTKRLAETHTETKQADEEKALAKV